MDSFPLGTSTVHRIGFGAIGATLWNLVLCALAVALVVYVYRREGRSKGARISLAAIRSCSRWWR